MTTTQLSRRNFLKSAGGLVAAINLSFLTGCDREETVKEHSEDLYEDAKVVQTIYLPSRHGKGSDIAPTVSMNGDGDISFGAAMVNVEVDIPQKYAVVFECQHGKFVVEGTGDKYKRLWEKLHGEEPVTITYREVYQTKYAIKSGQREVLERKLKDYWFVDAQPKAKKIVAEKESK